MQKSLVRKGLVIGIMILFVGASAVSSLTVKNKDRSVIHVYEGESIQDAIDAASSGDTILVHNGTYYEHITVNKQLYLVGEDNNTTIIDGTGTGNIVYVSANGVSISSFTIRNITEYTGPPSYPAALRLLSNDNVIYNNIFDYCQKSMLLDSSSNNIISYNFIKPPPSGSAGETPRFQSNCNNNWFHNNIVYGHTIRTLYNCDYNTFENNIWKDGAGITFNPDGHHNIVRYEYFENSSGCSPSQRSHDNEVYECTFIDGWFSISDYQASHGNIIWHNDFINCSIIVKFGGNYMYSPSLEEGNYWSDYTGEDNNGDGIGDTPYTVPGEAVAQDLYPLMNPFNYHLLPDIVYVDDDYNESTPSWGYNHFDSIQDGINAVFENGTVYVFNGTYYENITIGKTINLIGENKNQTIIDANGSGYVIYVSANSVNISGFTIRDGASVWDGNIAVHSNNNCIFGNIIVNNSGTLGSICLTGASNNNIFDNSIIDNHNDWGASIYIMSSSNMNNIYGNDIIGNSGQARGIEFFSASNNNIFGNIISNTKRGIFLDMDSTNINITGNAISDNWDYGIWICSSSNVIHHNNFFNNTQHAIDSGINIWDNGYPSGGNYWDDYTGADADDDGIGDIPYNISGGSNQDLYPLMHPWDEMPPVANFSYEINDLRVTFNPMSSFDRDGEIDYVIWEFGEPPQMQGPLGLVNHTYSSYGDYDVTLTVVDNDGYEGNITQVVSVDDLIPPEIIDNTPSTGYTGDPFTFNATITDAGGIESAWVTWWYDSTAVSVELDYMGDDYYEKTITIQDTLDTMHYFIKVNDTSNNSQSTGTKHVTIYDNDKPEINDIHADPEIQIVGRYVNISAEVIDNIEVQSAYIHLRYPDAFEEDINITKNKIGNTYFLNQTYNQDGEHRYHLQATDTSGNIVISSTYMFNMRDNEPPYAPLISGPSSGQAGEEYTYSFSTSDPDGDDVYYYIDWGDGDVVEWIGPYGSDEIIELSHTWEEQDTYTISARAKDSWGAIGEWGTLEVEMPVNQQVINPLLQMILERFPNAFPILRYLLGL